MDNLGITRDNSLTNSYFLSSTASIYQTDEEIDLSEILREYQSLLSLSNDFEASSKKKKCPSTIFAGSLLNDDYCEKQDISHIRSEETFPKIGNIVRNFNISGTSFCLEKLENSIVLDRIEFSKNASCLSNSFNNFITITTDNDEKIENESCPFLINLSYEEYKSNNSEYKQNSLITPDIIVTTVSGNSFVFDDIDNDSDNEFSKANSMNLLSVDNTLNFFTRRKKERYFCSPKKLIDKYKRVGNKNIMNLSLNDDNHSKNFETDLDEDKFLKTVHELPNICLEDITIEWPPLEEINQENDEISFNTSTPNEDEHSFSKYFAALSPVKKIEKEINIESPTNFGVSGSRYFSARRGLKYFSTPYK